MTNAVSVRKARREDADFLLPLIDRASEGLAGYFWAQIAENGESATDAGRRRIESDDAGISYTNAWVAEADGRPAGCLIAYEIPESPEPVAPDENPMVRPLLELEYKAAGTGYVYVLSTRPDMRSHGVGTALLGFAERYRGPKGMSLIVADNNPRARALYERCGFQEKAQMPMVKNGWQSEGKNWVLMVRP